MLRKTTEERLAAEAEKREQERLARERERVLKVEMEALAALRTNARADIRIQQYDRVVADLKALQETLSLPESQTQAQRLQARYASIVELSTWAAEQTKARPWRWGYGTGSATVDIIGFDVSGMQVTGATVAWDALPVEQFLLIADIQISPEGRVTRPTAKYMFASGIWAEEAGLPTEATQRIDDALKIDPALQTRVAEFDAGPPPKP